MTWLYLAMALVAQGAATEARLVLPVETVKAGETVTVGVLLEMKEGWHTYWKNSGESGSATKINWALPAGVTAGEIQWPLPERYETGGLTTFVYHDKALLLIPLTFGSQVPAGDIELKAKVSWLECEKICVPGRTEIAGTLKISTETKVDAANAALIKAWDNKFPKASGFLNANAAWDGSVKDGKRTLLVQIPTSKDALQWDFFPYRGDGFEVSPKSEAIGSDPVSTKIKKVISVDEDKWPTEIKGVIVGGASADKPSIGFEASIPISSTLSAPVSASNSSDVKTTTAATPQPNPQSLFMMLIYAFIGGMILNIMPCVLPVISLKILGFVKQSQEAPGRVRAMGLLYGLGVVVSFLVMAGFVIALQQAGKATSWGMQFQNGQFLVVLTLLVTLISLNLFGVFEVSAGDNVMGAAGQLASKKGSSGAFFNGVLATILATPCTAPFLGISLGFAFSQPPVIILLFFVTIALGLASPYVILSFQPKWLRFLPKPGAWMEKFKILMGFPMLATAIWLFSLAANHFGNRGVLWLGLLLVLISLAAYIFGEFVQRGQKHQGAATMLALLIAVISTGYILEGELQWRNPSVQSQSGQSLAHESKVGIDWKKWTSMEVANARKEGHVVFVDFTADWCTTCQWNKKTSIELIEVKKKLDAVNAVSLLGDYTHEDPAIAQELKKYDRAGVPLVLVYPADPNAAPIVLPEILTPSIVLEALEKAGAKKLSSTK